MNDHNSLFPKVSPTIPCNLCRGTDVEQVGTVDREGEALTTVMCSRCGLVWTDPRPTEEQTRKFYRDDYRLAYKSTYTPRKKHALRETERAIERADRLTSLIQPGTRLLDVGSAGGFFLYVMRQRGVEIQGVEPNRGFAEFAQEELGIPTRNAFLQDVDFPAGGFDIATSHHVFEHLEDPTFSLKRIRNWVKPGGHLLIEVPNVEARYHAPNNRFHIGHLYNYNPYTMEGIGRKIGLEVVESTTTPGSGHVVVLFRRPESPIETIDEFENPENAARVRDVLSKHTMLSHYLSMTPYLRAATKQVEYLREWIKTQSFRSSRQVVEQLVGPPVSNHRRAA
ncbi:MAG: class I SAM-dependent methyltransferase [Planctomycetaceae bacterium]